MISILCPTRNRPAELARMVTSARETTSASRLFHGNHAAVEVVAYVDEDDTLSGPAATRLGCKVVVGPRRTLSQLWNECLPAAAGDLLMQGNDDMIFRTQGWDRLVERVFAECPDKILMAHGDDGVHHETFGPHPVVSRRWVEVVGYFTPPHFSSDYGDTWLNDVANILGRRRYLPFLLEHMHYVFGKAEVDDTTRERLARHSADNPKVLYDNLVHARHADASKLRHEIERVAAGVTA